MNVEYRKYIEIVLVSCLILGGFYFLGQQTDNRKNFVELAPSSTVMASMTEELQSDVDIVPALHIGSPEHVRGIYISGWSAGNKKSMDRIMATIDRGGINAVVIDIKDATGKLSYQPLDPVLRESGVGTNRIRDLSALIERLHENNIYVIGRLTVFQDPFYARAHPQEAFKDTRTNLLWTDYKGISWLRPDSQPVWDYTVAIARDAYAQGFDEINLDYVRFPSDGPLSTLNILSTAKYRVETMQSFFIYMDQELRNRGIVTSTDLFGLVMSSEGDIGIGQKLTSIAPYVDYVAPMIYPSHFGAGSYGYASPSNNPYEIIYRSMTDGIAKLEAVGIPKEKLRPWLQDFDLLGVRYTPDMVSAQIRAVNDAGVVSWMMWDPKNTYKGLAPE